MNPWFAKAIVLAAAVALVAIRAPHGERSRHIPVARSCKGGRETALLTMAWVSFFVPFVWIAAPVLGAADYPLHAVPLALGVSAYVLGLWLFHRSHADLGPAWSITLEIREEQRLVTHGVYRRIRHPMYLGLIAFGLGQALVLPNWIAGPSYLVAMVVITALRLGPEEGMLCEAFGDDYSAYAARTKRLIPFVW
jgi:protein-S-isoprenylcysteine O-methyltransferase Ste14